MEHKKVLIIEDLPATQKQLKIFYDEKNIESELYETLWWGYEKIVNIIDEWKLSEYEYILMDGELNGSSTNKLIEILLSENNVPPVISISASEKHSQTYQLPYADKLWIINNLKYILWEEVDTNMLPEKAQDHQKYKNLFNNRQHNIDTRKQLMEVFDQKEILQQEEVILQPTGDKIPLFRKLLSLLSKNKS